VARGPAVGPLSSVLRGRLRSGSLVNGKTRSSRYLPVVSGFVRVPGARGEAGAAQADSRGVELNRTTSSVGDRKHLRAANATPPPNPSPVPTAQPLVADTAERDVRVETKEVIAVFTNRGARLKSWRLKRYFGRDGQPQEIIESNISSQPLPFTLRTADETATTALNGGLYTVSGAPAAPVATAPVDLRFEYRDASGLRAIKEFHLDPGSYVVKFKATVTQGESAVTPTIVWGPAVGDVGGQVSQYSQKAEALHFQNGKVQRTAPKDLAKQSVFEGDFKFIGVDDNYFMVAALFSGPVKVSFHPVSIPPPPNTKDPARDLVSFSLDAQQADGPHQFFVGPKDFTVLASIDRDLTRAINFGMFAVIVVPLLNSLKWVNAFVGNYGWSIVILTILINAVMFPLRHWSTMSMRRMQEIQPQVKAIQDRYAKLKTTDPAKQKMNQELMALYKERGVNPVGGCVDAADDADSARDVGDAANLDRVARRAVVRLDSICPATIRFTCSLC
jgi:YidC/Oxa1 family membrane protein insertase